MPRKHSENPTPQPMRLVRRIAGILTVLACGGFLPNSSMAAPPPVEAPLPPHADLSYFLDAQGGRQPIHSLADWERRRAQILQNMQRVMGKLPHDSLKVPLQMKVLEDTPLPGLIRRKLQYQTTPHDSVRAWLFLPTARPGTPRPAILCLHQTTAIGKDEPAGRGGNPNLHYALHLAQRGYVTLAPDYPSFGEYSFDFASADFRSHFGSGSLKAIWDNQRALDLLAELPAVDGKRIGCIGHSLGGHNTMFTAAFDPRIKVLVSNCGFTRFHKYYGGKLKGWTSTRYMPVIDREFGNDPNRVPFDFPEIIASFAPRPFLASAPVNDGNFEVSGVREAIAAARPIYALYGKSENLAANYPPSAHDFPESARKVAYEFFDKHLQHQPGK